jgi:hypothetical protein
MILIGLLFTPGSAFAAKGTVAEQYDVKLVARHDGSLMVTETIVLRFEGGPFTYVFREIPTEFTDGLTGFVASMDGEPFPNGEAAGQVEVKKGKTVRVTWHFPPVSSSTHTFILSYRALGVTRIDEKYDLLIWNAIPFEHDYPILASTIQLTYPRRSKVAQDPRANLDNVRIKSSGSSILFQTKNLQNDDGFQVTVRFNRNSLISELPTWQRHKVETSRAIYRVLPWALATFALLLLGGIGALYLTWEQNANLDRGEGTPAAVAPHQTAPPGDLPPAFAGALLTAGAEPAWPHALASLLDLARRGIVIIKETGEKNWLRQRDFSIQIQSHPEDLFAHEHGLLGILFESPKGPRTSLKVSDIRSAIPGNFWKFTKPLEEEMERAGLLSSRRKAIRNRMTVAGTVLFVSGLVGIVLSLIAAWVSIDADNWTVMSIVAITLGMAASCTLIGLIFGIVGSFYSPLTEKGIQEAASWRAYSEYLREVTREREPVTGPGLFESALPYAAGFGLGEAWSRFFQKHGENRLPPWLKAISTSGEAAAAAGDNAAVMNAFVALMVITNSVGSGNGTGATGGAGAAGGGSSGAG